MTLHPLAEGFAEVAGAYERGRPDYPPTVVGVIAAELGIPPDAPVLDLAAGTGKFARALLGAGLDVVAVEPQARFASCSPRASARSACARVSLRPFRSQIRRSQP